VFDIPRDMILPVDGVDVRLEPAPHPFEAQNLDAIEENWRAERAANPALFDGTTVLLSSLSYSGRRLAGRCHAIRYATFMHWRRHRSISRAEHAFAHAMLVAADNALVAIRMGAHTANPGRVYFAAGSFEPIDFPDGTVDLHLNMARELREETGLSIDHARREDQLHFISLDTGTVIFRRYFLDQDADTIATLIRAFVASEDEPEIEGPVIIRNASDLPDGLMAQMMPLVAWHFANPPRSE
jgi:8-oxo-dGTP pyrophosphatase MutT (NUDIX family)